jgi:hypothetical protein
MTQMDRNAIHGIVSYKELNQLADEIGITRAMIQRIYYGRQEVTQDKKWIYEAIINKAKENLVIKYNKIMSM